MPIEKALLQKHSMLVRVFQKIIVILPLKSTADLRYLPKLPRAQRRMYVRPAVDFVRIISYISLKQTILCYKKKQANSPVKFVD